MEVVEVPISDLGYFLSLFLKFKYNHFFYLMIHITMCNITDTHDTLLLYLK